MNRAYEEVRGRPCQALYEGPSSWLDAIHPDDRARVVSGTMARAQSADWQFFEQYRIRRPDGGIRWILDTGVPITEDAMAGLAVCDTGAGISSAVADRMFDAFFTTKQEGLGIGLTVSAFITEAHGGRLVVSPNPESGATARFTLPLRQKGNSYGI